MRVNIDVLYPQSVGDHARVLPPCPSEANQRVVTDVVAPFNTDFFDGVGHVVRSDIQETLGDTCLGLGCPCFVGDLFS